MPPDLELQVDVRSHYRGAVPLSGPLSGNAKVCTGDWKLLGWSAQEAGSNTLDAVMFDGQDTNGQPVGTIVSGANGASQLWMGPNGIRLRSGLYVEVITALTHLTFWMLPLDHY